LVLGWLAGQVMPSLWARQDREPMAPAADTAPDDKSVVAYVNGTPITRQDLGEYLIARRGRQQLPILIDRTLIEQECRKHGITVSEAEVEAELRKEMKLTQCETARQFEEQILMARLGKTLAEYKDDALRVPLLQQKLAGTRVEVTDEDLRKAFEANYGEKVECRMILVPSDREAFRIHQEVNGKSLDDFIRAAQKYNADNRLAATGGKIRPINRHSSLDKVEEEAFRLQDGEVSLVMQVPEGHLILFRERLIPPQQGVEFEKVKKDLHEDIYLKKRKAEVGSLMRDLRSKAVVRDYLNNKFGIKEMLGGNPGQTPQGKTTAPKGGE
jgi:hypothetical protein